MTKNQQREKERRFANCKSLFAEEAGDLVKRKQVKADDVE
jgi:hypothetical protein